MSSSNLSTTTATMSPTLHDGGEEDGLGGLLCDEARRSRSGRLLLADSSDQSRPLVSKTYSSNSTEGTTWLSLSHFSHCRRVFAAGSFSHESPLRTCFNILSFKPLGALLAELSLSCFAGPNLRFFAFPSACAIYIYRAPRTCAAYWYNDVPERNYIQGTNCWRPQYSKNNNRTRTIVVTMQCFFFLSSLLFLGANAYRIIQHQSYLSLSTSSTR